MTESEYRAKLKANHICRDCKQTDAYTLAGRTYCADCAKKMANRKREKRTESREEYSAKRAEYRKKLIEEKRCSRCGKKLPDGWKRKLCIECLTYFRRKAEERRREKGQKTWDMRCQDGVCFVCGAKSMDGKRMCQACYDKRVPIAIENLKKAVDTGKRV